MPAFIGRDDASAMTFEEVYDAHFPFVWRSLRRMGVREDDVADAVQDVFLVVYRKLDAFDHRAKVTTWLFKVCFNVASARRRLAYSRREIASGEVETGYLGSEEEVSRTLDRRRAAELLVDVMDQLPDDQRAVFSLFELEAWSASEIAAMLEVPEGTIRSRLRLARESFRRAVTRFAAADRSGTAVREVAK